MEITFNGNKKISATIDGFTVDTDQPLEKGGDNSAPPPYVLFLASFGTCAGYFVKVFCDTRKISTEGLKLSFDFEKDEKTRLVSKIITNIQLPAEFPKKYHSAIVKAVDQCAVKKSIHNPPEFAVKLNGMD